MSLVDLRFRPQADQTPSATPYLHTFRSRLAVTARLAPLARHTRHLRARDQITLRLHRRRRLHNPRRLNHNTHFRTCNLLVFLAATPRPTSVYKAGRAHRLHCRTTTAALRTVLAPTLLHGLRRLACLIPNRTTNRSATPWHNTSFRAPRLFLLVSPLLHLLTNLPQAVLPALRLALVVTTRTGTTLAGNCPVRDSHSRELIPLLRLAEAAWQAMCTTCSIQLIRRNGRARMREIGRRMRGRGRGYSKIRSKEYLIQFIKRS